LRPASTTTPTETLLATTLSTRATTACTGASDTIVIAFIGAGLFGLIFDGFEFGLLLFGEHGLDLVDHLDFGNSSLGNRIDEGRGGSLDGRFVTTVTNDFLQGLLGFLPGGTVGLGLFSVGFHNGLDLFLLFFGQIQLTYGAHDHEAASGTATGAALRSALKPPLPAFHVLFHARAAGAALLLTAPLSPELVGAEQGNNHGCCG
jgi:hypothetical protein